MCPFNAGVVHVSFQEDKEGNISFVAHLSDDKAIKKFRRKSSHSSSDEETASEIEGAHLIQSPTSSLTKASVGKHRLDFKIKWPCKLCN